MHRGRRFSTATAGTALLFSVALLGVGACGSSSSDPSSPGPSSPGPSSPGPRSPEPSSPGSRSTALPLPPVTDVSRGEDPAVPFTTDVVGEVVLATAASATGASWGTAGGESAVVSLFVDDRYVSDLVVPSARPTDHSIAVGELAAGTHTLRIQFASDRSPRGATSVTLADIRIETITVDDPEYLAARHSPVLYGRTIDGLPGTVTSGPFQNAVTDTPLLAWHTVGEPDAGGHRVLEYTTMWSNEDGGTATPALMARWGRTTDIEWTYRVTVDASGEPVPGTAAFQAPEHVQTDFRGRYEGSHPVLGTCTLNNNVCDSVGTETGAPMRFALAATEQLGSGEAREVMMDRHPWTYQVMADEVRREGRVSAQPLFGVQINDPSEYLYVIVGKTTVGAPNTDDSWVGLALGVRLAGDPTGYRSDLSVPVWTIARDGAVATAIRLPTGTDPSDVVGIDAFRIVGEGADTGATLEVDNVTRAFLLDDDGLPGPPLAGDTTPVALTAAAPSAALFTVG